MEGMKILANNGMLLLVAIDVDNASAASSSSV